MCKLQKTSDNNFNFKINNFSSILSWITEFEFKMQ